MGEIDDSAPQECVVTLTGLESHPVKVIIAEHSTGMRACLVQALFQLPNVQIVASVPDYAGALSAAIESRPDVIIMSSKLVGGTGVDLLAAIREVSAGIFTIFFSGNLSRDLRQLCLRLGADAVLEKPYGIKTLLDLVGGMANDRKPSPGDEPDLPSASAP